MPLTDITIAEQDAIDIAMAYREMRAAQELLEQVTKTMERAEPEDIRDAYGRRVGGLQLGVPSGTGSQRLFTVPWAACKPIIEAHIAAQKAIISTLSAKVASGLEAEAV